MAFSSVAGKNGRHASSCKDHGHRQTACDPGAVGSGTKHAGTTDAEGPDDSPGGGREAEPGRSPARSAYRRPPWAAGGNASPSGVSPASRRTRLAVAASPPCNVTGPNGSSRPRCIRHPPTRRTGVFGRWPNTWGFVPTWSIASGRPIGSSPTGSRPSSSAAIRRSSRSGPPARLSGGRTYRGSRRSRISPLRGFTSRPKTASAAPAQKTAKAVPIQPVLARRSPFMVERFKSHAPLNLSPRPCRTIQNNINTRSERGLQPPDTWYNYPQWCQWVREA